MEGLIPISEGAREYLQKRFPGRDVLIGLDAAVVIGHPANMAVALLCVPIALLLALVLPGNRMLPFGDLAALPFYVLWGVAASRGNMVRGLINAVVIVVRHPLDRHEPRLRSRPSSPAPRTSCPKGWRRMPGTTSSGRGSRSGVTSFRGSCSSSFAPGRRCSSSESPRLSPTAASGGGSAAKIRAQFAERDRGEGEGEPRAKRPAAPTGRAARSPS